MYKTSNYNSVEYTYCAFKCCLNCQVASFEALRSLEENHRRSNATVERGSFFASCRTKTRSVKTCIIFNVFLYHPVKDFVDTERCIFGTQQKPRRTSLIERAPATVVAALPLLDTYALQEHGACQTLASWLHLDDPFREGQSTCGLWVNFSGACRPCACRRTQGLPLAIRATRKPCA